MRAQFFRLEGKQKDRQRDSTNLIFAFRNFAKVPKKRRAEV